MIGFLITALAGLCTYPISSIRKILICQKSGESKKYNGVIDLVKDYVKKGRVRELYIGSFETIGMGLVMHSVVVLGYSMMKNWFKLILNCHF